jgi:hypothetical protein
MTLAHNKDKREIFALLATWLLEIDLLDLIFLGTTLNFFGGKPYFAPGQRVMSAC